MRKTTVDLMQDIETDSTIDVIPQTSELFRNALRLYEERLDQAWSHTDCASFLIMQQQSILEALTHVSEALRRNRHFEQAGFIALLR